MSLGTGCSSAFATVVEPQLRRREGRRRGNAGARIDRGRQRHLIRHAVENDEQAGPHQDRVGNPQHIRIGCRQLFHQPDHVVAEIARKPARHRRQALRHVEPRLRDQIAQALDRRIAHRQERRRIGACVAVDRRDPFLAAPDQIRRHADHGIAPARRPAFHAFQQEGVRLAMRHLHKRRNRRQQVGNIMPPDQRAAPRLISGTEFLVAVWRNSVHRLSIIDKFARATSG